MTESLKQLTPEEIREDLTRPIVLPDNAKNFFSGKRLEPFLKLYQHPTVVELNMMANEPGMAKDMDFIEYCTFLPEWRTLNRHYHEAAEELYDFFKQRIPGAVKQVFDIRRNFHPGPLLELYSAVVQLVNSLASARGDVQVPYSVVLQKSLLSTLFAKMSYDLIEEAQKIPGYLDRGGTSTETSKVLQDRMSQLGRHLAKTNRAIFPWGFPGFAEQPSIARIKATNRKHARGLEELEHLGATAPKISELQKSVDERYELLAELVNEVDFDDFEYRGKNFKIRFYNMRRSLPKGARANYLFKCNIALDPGIQQSLGQVLAVEGNVEGLGLNVGLGHYDLYTESDKSSLFISPALGYDLMFEDKARYLRICNAVYGILMDHLLGLESKEEESEKALIESVTTLVEQTSESIDQAISTQEPSAADKAAQEVQEKKVSFSLKNRQGSRVLKALTKLLGPPVRCEGTSHFIFRGRQGNTYPISLHGDKDVGVGLLQTCLKKYGIKRKDFVKAY